jgi:hypothetical protein
MTRVFAVVLGLISIAVGVALRLIMVRLNLVNGSVEVFMPLTYVAIGASLLIVKNRIVLILLGVVASLGLLVIGVLAAMAGAAPYAR